MTQSQSITDLMKNLSVSAPTDDLVKLAKSDFRALEPIVSDLVDKLKTHNKKNADEAKNALACVEALAKDAMLFAQPFLVKYITEFLDVCGQKNTTPEVRTAAENTVKAIFEKISANCVREILPNLFAACEITKNWQSRVAALRAIESFGDHAPEQLGFSLPDVVPEVSKSMVDLKAAVAKAATDAMTSACDVVGNRDIEHLTGDIIRSITHPDEVDEIMYKLAGVRFVQSVESPALAMVTPLLLRGLRSGNRVTVRQSAVIIENMSKLVDHPIDAAPFLPLLMPALEKAADIMSDPEARGVAERSAAQLNRLDRLCKEALAREQHIEDAKVIPVVNEIMGNPKNCDRVIEHIASLCCSLMSLHKFDDEHWSEILEHLSIIDAEKAKSGLKKLQTDCEAMARPLPERDDDDDDAEELCNCTFTLAYGTKILLHNTKMRLKRGAKYGLLGGNDSGKTSLMRAIANGSVEGFPDPAEVRTVFVEADILGELSHLSCVDYIMQDPRLQGLPKEEVLQVMATVGFTNDGKAKPHHPVSSLSGGWRMKLAMARAMLQKADILLLDEPTNHLDVINVAWVKNYINSLKNVTCIMVSHDSGFLRDCCTHILQISNLKLQTFKGNLDDFIEQNPEAKSYFDLKKSKLKFTFPQPGPIEGIKSRSKALMKMGHCYFTYPGNEKPTLYDITIQVSMASRVGCVGENGAGKSTMIKVLTGEVVPQKGDVWKHPNVRVAYVAQHAFHHIEQHLDKTPNEYIRWRYANGEDKESLVKVSMVFTPEEEKLQKTPFEWKDPESGKVFKKVVTELMGSRRTNKQTNEFEYECKFKGQANITEGTYIGMKTLVKNGWEKACKAIDARIAQTAGMFTRPLSAVNVEKHLGDVGLDAEFATHYRMNALSGGQKVKVVMAAALWNQPHILILDEPTNYLDRDSLGALATAIEEFQGGVVIISHNNEFVKTICKEEWIMESGHLTTKGDSNWMDRQDDKIQDQAAITEMTDAVGNVVEVKQKKKLSKREEKAMIKAVRVKINNGDDLNSDEEEFAFAHNLFAA